MAKKGSDGFPVTSHAECPWCKRAIYFPTMRVATEVYRRKCRGCGERWQMIVAPRAVTILGAQNGALIQAVTFNRITD